jgi:hypothetical protein
VASGGLAPAVATVPVELGFKGGGLGGGDLSSTRLEEVGRGGGWRHRRDGRAAEGHVVARQRDCAQP